LTAADPDSGDSLFERAPCGYLSATPDGSIVRANATLESWLQVERGALGGRRFQDLLTGGGRIYHETHYAPLLQMQGWVREIALEVVRSDGTRLPVLVTSALQRGDGDAPDRIRTILFDASDRRRYEQELLDATRREEAVALELQRSLLAGAPPADPAFALAVAYEPAEVRLEVGGDWYDAFWIGEESVAVVVGDVVGRGIDAAATMSQLRTALRAYAVEGLEPAAVVAKLHRLVGHLRVGLSTTLTYLDLDPFTLELRYVSAGHLPALHAPVEGSPRFLTGARSTPLGAAPAETPIPQERLVLSPGDALLLYTDGLVERRDAAIDDRLEALRAELQSAPADLTEQLKQLTERLVSGSAVRSDDIALLALRAR
jgi:hypothetical protein